MGLENLDNPITEQMTVFGASLVSFSCNLGWNDTESSIDFVLAEDSRNGDEFTRPTPGTPLYFNIGDTFEFNGLVLNWQKEKSTNGFIYLVRVVDPRSLLANTKVICGGFHGAVSDTFPNLISAVYFYEQGIFGFAGVNEGGMLWSRTMPNPITSVVGTTSNELGVKRAILDTVNGPKPILFQGNQFRLNLDNLPQPPQSYRILGDVVSIMDCITQICQDGGSDFFVRLEKRNGEHTIVLYTVSRRSQPPVVGGQTGLGPIEVFANQKEGTTLISNRAGLELRNENTSIVIFGGKIQYMETATPLAYWGQDINNNPIINTAQANSDSFDINAITVADILGTTTYTVTIAELRFALISEDAWQTYLAFAKKSMAQQLDLAYYDVSKIKNLYDIQNWSFKNQDGFISQYNKTLASQSIDTDDLLNKAHRVYQMVYSYASTYYGRKFWVPIQGVYKIVDSETGQESFNIEPVTEGFSVSPPLGLPAEVTDLYTTEDGRYKAFIKYTDVSQADPTQFNSPEIYSPDGSTLFMFCDVDPNMVLYDGEYGVVITVNSPVFRKANNFILNDITEIASILGFDSVQLKKLANQPGFSFPFDMHPVAGYPSSAAIPVQNNSMLYGPYTKQGAIGGVDVRIMTDLVPWNYGGISYMEAAVNAILQNADTQQLVAELGNIELAGAPEVNLGDKLVSTGPNVTSIDVSVGAQGITTRYTMRTYTPRLGAFSKYTADRIQKIGKSALELNRKARQQQRYRESIKRQLALASYRFKRNVAEALRNKSPHQVCVGYYDTNYQNVCYVSTMTAQEARGKLGPNFDDRAGMSLDGVLRPFAMSAYGNLAAFEEPEVADDYLPHTKHLNPFPSGAGFFTTGNTEDTFYVNTYEDGYDSADPDILGRGLGLRYPVVFVGWGYDFKNEEIAGVDKGNPATWKVGALDVKWDDLRKVWCSPGILSAKTWGSIPSGSYSSPGTGLAIIHSPYYGPITVHNDYKVSIPDNTTVKIGWAPMQAKWWILSADCESD